jgi:hypothetical protein
MSFSQLLNPAGKVWIKAGQLGLPAVVEKYDIVSIRLRRHLRRSFREI